MSTTTPQTTIHSASGETPIPDHIADLAILIHQTENHDDPIVRTIRKLVVQAALALQAVTQPKKPLPTSAPDETPTDSHDETTAPPRRPTSSKPSAPPSGAEPSRPHVHKGEMSARKDDAGDIREWAAAHDIDCSRVGPIPRRVRMLYEAAQKRGEIR